MNLHALWIVELNTADHQVHIHQADEMIASNLDRLRSHATDIHGGYWLPVGLANSAEEADRIADDVLETQGLTKRCS